MCTHDRCSCTGMRARMFTCAVTKSRVLSQIYNGLEGYARTFFASNLPARFCTSFQDIKAHTKNVSISTRYRKYLRFEPQGNLQGKSRFPSRLPRQSSVNLNPLLRIQSCKATFLELHAVGHVIMQELKIHAQPMHHDSLDFHSLSPALLRPTPCPVPRSSHLTG